MNVLTKIRKDPQVLKCLTEKELMFCHKYLDGFNATQAAIDAGYSEKTAASIGCKLLKKTKIKKALQYLGRPMLEESGVTVQLILKRIFEILTYRVDDLFDENGVPLPPSELPERVQSLVDGYEMEISYNELTGEEKRKMKLKITPRTNAIDQGMKYLNMILPEMSNGEKKLLLDYDKELGGRGSSSQKIEDQINGND